MQKISRPNIVASSPRLSLGVLPQTPRLGNFGRDSGRNLHTANSLTRSRVRLPTGAVSPNPDRPPAVGERVPLPGEFPGFSHTKASLSMVPRRCPSPWTAARRPVTSGRPEHFSEGRPEHFSEGRPDFSKMRGMCFTRAFDVPPERAGLPFAPPRQNKERYGMDLAGASALMSLGSAAKFS